MAIKLMFIYYIDNFDILFIWAHIIIFVIKDSQL